MLMDSKRIEILLERYWLCTTTLEEEEELKQFFNSDEIPDHLKEYAGLFQYFNTEKQTSSLDPSFDKELMDKIKSDRQLAGKSRRMIFNYIKVAAAIVIVMIASFLYRKNLTPDSRPEILGTYQDPKEAYEETKRVLMMVASKLNNGKKYIENVGAFNEAKEKVEGENNTDNKQEKSKNNKQIN